MAVNPVRVPIIKFLSRRFPGYRQLPRSELSAKLELLQKNGEIVRLVAAEEGQQGIKLGRVKREPVFYAFVELGRASPVTERIAAETPRAPRLRMPRYSTVGTGRDDFFRSHLEIEVATHFGEVEPRFRGRQNGQRELSAEIQRFVDRCIAEWRGEDPDQVPAAKQRPGGKARVTRPARLSPIGAKLARAKTLRKEGKDTYTPTGGPKFVRFYQGGAPE